MELSKETKTKLFLSSNAVGINKFDFQEDEYTLAFLREQKKLASWS